jgi:ribosomal protein S18 acetylase RimI-like enzyme
MDDNYADKIKAAQVQVIGPNHEPVGVLVLIQRDNHLLIENVAVDPDHQGQAVGRRLLAHAEITAARLNLPELRRYTNAAMTENLKLYLQLGYREIERRTDQGFERVFFAKSAPNNVLKQPLSEHGP